MLMGQQSYNEKLIYKERNEMQKMKKSLAKFLVSALLLPLLAGVGPATLTVLAADFLAGTVPSQVYLNVYLTQSISGDAYIGWTVVADDHYTGEVTKHGDTYYIGGAAAFNNSYKDADGSPYTGYFSSTDLAKWTLITSQVDGAVWSEGQHMTVNIPLDYRVVTTTGRTVNRGGDSTLITTADLINVIPPMPQAEIINVEYTIVGGDSLAAIANKYGVTVDAIKAANKTYFNDLAARNAAAGTNVPLEKDAVLTIPTTKMNGVKYTVRPGDTLWGIAFNYYGTMRDSKVIEIKNANKEIFQQSKGVLEAGATIYLPPNGIRNPVTTTHLDQAVGVYRVKIGDTVSGLNKKYYGAQADFLGKVYEANNERIKKVGNSYMIYEQQWLVIIK